MDKRYTLPIARITKETEDINTYTFYHNLGAEPGQFIMLTDFEGGEKPFSISLCSAEEFSVTIKRVGDFTNRLFKKKVGDLISFRGAYGSSFFISKKRVLLVGGGYAVPTLFFLSKKLLESGADVTLINGARNKEEHVFADRFATLPIKIINTTDDGSFGKKGTSVDITKELLKTESYNQVYASGPEMMMKALQPVLVDHEYEYLFERYMKCAIGICGCCTMDPLGIRLCVEGPVLPREKVEQLKEFGKYHRKASGRKIYFKKEQ